MIERLLKKMFGDNYPKNAIIKINKNDSFGSIYSKIHNKDYIILNTNTNNFYYVIIKKIENNNTY